MRQVGKDELQPLPAVFDRLQLLIELLARLCPLPVAPLERGRVDPLALGLPDFSSGGVLVALEPLDPGQHLPARGLERRQLVELLPQVGAAVPQRLTYTLRVVT